MNKTYLAIVTAGIIATSFSAFAQTNTANDPNTSRIKQIDQRLQNQQNRINAGVQNGKINPTQAAKDEARDAKVSSELSADEAKNGGHITKAEQRRMNRQLKHDSKKINHQIKKAGTATPVPVAQ